MNKRIWNFELKIIENDDDLFKNMPADTLNSQPLKNFIVDCLFANGFETKIRQTAFSQIFDEDFDSYQPVVQQSPSVSNTG